MYYSEEAVFYTTLKKKIEEYTQDYNTERIEAKLSGISPVELRK